MKRIRDDIGDALVDAIICQDVLVHMGRITSDFPVWYALVRTCRALWQQSGGFVRVVEAYAWREVRGKGMVSFPHRLIHLATYVPLYILEPLTRTPLADAFRTLEANECVTGMSVAGGYVRNEVVRALRAAKVPWLHRDIKCMNTARDTDIYVDSKASIEGAGRVLGYFANLPESDALRMLAATPGPVVSSVHATLGAVDIVLRDTLLSRYRTRVQYDARGAAVLPIHVGAWPNTLAGFDLSCAQFELTDAWYHTGNVNTTPWALYSLMMGKMIALQLAPTAMVDVMESPIPDTYGNITYYDLLVRRIFGRLDKYHTQYGYTLEMFDDAAIAPKVLAYAHGYVPGQRVGALPGVPSGDDDYGPLSWARAMVENGVVDEINAHDAREVEENALREKQLREEAYNDDDEL